jgi:hypothetical protein
MNKKIVEQILMNSKVLFRVNDEQHFKIPIREGTIVDISPSEKFIKIKEYSKDMPAWYDVEGIEFLEKLNQNSNIVPMDTLETVHSDSTLFLLTETDTIDK